MIGFYRLNDYKISNSKIFYQWITLKFIYVTHKK